MYEFVDIELTSLATSRSDFAVKGDQMTVEPSVEKVIKEFHSAKKPIG